MRAAPNRIVSLLCVLGAAACATAAAPPTHVTKPQPRDRAATLSDVVAQALPALVLLLNDREDGKTTFGAGFVVQDGLVVTCLHVVDDAKRVTAMLYDPSRRGYTPMDGGLPRFLFENQVDLVPVHVVAKDASLDLAVLRMDADTTELPKLPWQTTSVRPGDRVLALGHPQETVWSFTEGVVGSLQQGMVQHDAIIGPGSSGGPLLNEKGEVIGVNVAHVVSEPVGLSWARPIALVADVFAGRRLPAQLDLSTPASAAVSCWRAQELGLSEAGHCFDWETEWVRYVDAAHQAEKMVSTHVGRDRIDGCTAGDQTKRRWIAKQRDDVTQIFDPSRWGEGQSERERTLSMDPSDPAFPDAFRDQLARAISKEKAARTGTPEDDGLTVDYRDPRRMLARIRQGLRVERTEHVAPGLTWVLIAFKNGEGSVSKLSELYVRVEGKWLQRALPEEREVGLLPSGWPSPPHTFDSARAFCIADLLEVAAKGGPCPFDRHPAQKKPRQGGVTPSLHPRYAP